MERAVVRPTANQLNEIANEYNLKGDIEAARHHYCAALAIDPANPAALVNLSVIYSHQGKFAAAISMAKKAIAVAPLNGNFWNNLGNYLMLNRDFSEAEAALNHALILTPMNIDTLYNLALLYHRQQDTESAIVCLRKCMDLGQVGPGAWRDLAHMQLKLGENLQEALRMFEMRWTELPHLPAWDYHIPEWQGEDLKGKRVLFHAEQGYGDTLMCARFYRNLRARGADVVMSVQDALIPLFQSQLWVTEVSSIVSLSEEEARAFHFQTPHFSAMRWLGTEWDNIDPAPYIIPPEIWTPEVDKSLFNVGICWASGKRNNFNDFLRRVSPLSDWLPLTETLGTRFYSLQKEAGSEDVEDIGADGLIEDRAQGFIDWSHTAAFISKLDLIISVDTAVAHLAGAMGKPVWMISQYTPCWRWQKIREGSGLPWYNSMRIFTQSDPKSWKEPLAQCRNLLQQNLIQEKQKRAA